MRRLMMTVAILFGLATAAQAQSFTLGQPLSAAWDPDPNEVSAAVDRYEWQMDADTNWTTAGVTLPQATYLMPLPQARLTLGTHELRMRSCAGTTCSLNPLAVTFDIGRPLPAGPRNPRVVPTPSVAVLTIPQAIDRANAYGLLILDRTLTSQELGYLSMRHPPVPPTRETVIGLLDSVFADFVIR